MKIVIPARAGSKGLPHKNRILLNHTLNSLPPGSPVWISTDDPTLAAKAKQDAVQVHYRTQVSATDEAPVTACLQEFCRDTHTYGDELVIMLYLTYPGRVWGDIEKAIQFLHETKASSLLCRYPVADHPYLCFMEDPEDTTKGLTTIPHNLYRRQEYPKCFVVSHYISLFKASELPLLGPNLYNDATVFFPIQKPVDIDTPSDLTKYMDKVPHGS